MSETRKHGKPEHAPALPAERSETAYGEEYLTTFQLERDLTTKQDIVRIAQTWTANGHEDIVVLSAATVRELAEALDVL